MDFTRRPLPHGFGFNNPPVGLMFHGGFPRYIIHIGFIKTWIKKYPQNLYSYTCGMSAGNIACLAAADILNIDKIVKATENLEEKHIYTLTLLESLFLLFQVIDSSSHLISNKKLGFVSKTGIVLSSLLGKVLTLKSNLNAKSIYSNKPLKQTLARVFDLEYIWKKSPIKIEPLAFEKETETPFSWTNFKPDHLNDPFWVDKLIRTVVGGASPPLIFPVEKIDGNYLVDAGIHIDNILPVERFANANCKMIAVLKYAKIRDKSESEIGSDVLYQAINSMARTMNNFMIKYREEVENDLKVRDEYLTYAEELAKLAQNPEITESIAKKLESIREKIIGTSTKLSCFGRKNIPIFQVNAKIPPEIPKNFDFDNINRKVVKHLLGYGERIGEEFIPKILDFANSRQ